jgi:4-alpha-glucanotransferase
VRPRLAGVNIPLFSIRSTASWGIGELTGIVPVSEWMREAGLRRLMILPLGTMQPGQSSPYAAASTMSIDPIFVAVEEVADFARGGGVSALSGDARSALGRARAAPGVLHEAVRRAKDEALGIAFDRFMTDEWEQLTPRASALAAYAARERWWLDDYALFQALSRSMPDTYWRDWPADLRDRAPRALDDARRQLGTEVLRQQYWQWIAETQWQQARDEARANGVEIVGDLPFVAGTGSAEVWARAGEFMLDVSVGVPPDAFSPIGQDWGLPAYAWRTIAASDFAWFRQRARRAAALFEGIRVDHAIGLYRTYCRPPGGDPFFNPADPPSQMLQGETVFGIFAETSLDLIAEDLGVVPDFVRDSLDRLGVPGCRVMRWERDWKRKGEPFIDPATYPAVSTAMTGTHDTEPLALWWDICEPADRAAALALVGRTDETWTPALRDALLAVVYQAASEAIFLPIQDIFGWPDRVNTPGTVGDFNWTWCLPWAVDTWQSQPAAVERADFLRRLTVATGRDLRVRTPGGLD